MKSNKPKYLILAGFFAMAFYMAGCDNNNISTPEKYVSYIKENEKSFSDSVEVNGLHVFVKYLPAEYVALMGSDRETFMENKDALIKNYLGAEYYELDLFKPDDKTSKYLKTLADSMEESAYDAYYNFSFQNDLQLKIGNEVLPCKYLHREISDAITNHVKYTLAFNVPNDIDSALTDRIIMINSNVFKLNNLNIPITASQIASVPQLKIK